MSAKLKRCACCKQLYPEDAFGLNRSTPDGLSYYTREHAARKQKEFRGNNPELVRAARDRYLDKLRARNDAARV